MSARFDCAKSAPTRNENKLLLLPGKGERHIYLEAVTATMILFDLGTNNDFTSKLTHVINKSTNLNKQSILIVCCGIPEQVFLNSQRNFLIIRLFSRSAQHPLQEHLSLEE